MTEKRGGKKICKRKICKKKMRSLMLCLILAAASAGCGVKAPGSAGESGAGLSGAEVSGAAKSEAGASGAGKSAEDASGTDTSGGGTSEAGAFGAEPSAAGIPEAAGDRDIGAAVQDFGLRLLQSCLESQKFPPYASLPEHVYDALEEGGNVLVSPLSIVSALTMTANGARGDTLDQMETALGMSAQELDAFFQDYERVFTFGEKCRLSMADSI